MTKQLFYGFIFVALSSAIWVQAQQAASPAPSKPAAQSTQASASQAPAAKPASVQGASKQDSANAVPTLQLGVNEVNLIFTVTDKHGHFIPNLKQNDFALLDDGRAPAKVTSFREQVNLPLHVGIMIDTSTSISMRFKFEQRSAIDFLLSVLRGRGDRAFIMGFNSKPTVYQDWTNNLDGLETGIDKMSPGGGTALFDAVYTACRYKMLDTTRSREPVRKIIILLTDGDDNESHVYEDEAIKECQRADTMLYAISTNWSPSRDNGDKVLAALTRETGGQVFYPPSANAVVKSFSKIEEELRSQYVLTYIPADFKYNGAFRPIYLYCKNRRYHARARKGYFAPRHK